MSSFARLTDEERGRILELRDMGMSIRKIAENVKKNKSTVEKLLKDPENHARKPRSGRPPLVDDQVKKKIKNLAAKDNISASQIRSKLSLPISTRRVQQILKSSENDARAST